jgi:DNA polymerase-4
LQETTFAQDVRDRATLERTIRSQAAEVAAKLQRKDLMGSAVKIKIRWPDFSTPTRQLTLPQATDDSEVIAEAALRLFGQIWSPNRPVRLIGVGISGLGTAPRQLSLWEAPTGDDQRRQAKMQAALAALQNRFGNRLIRRASDLGPLEQE